MENPDLLFRLLVEQTPELLCLHGLDGTFLFANPASLPVLGYEPQELLGEDAYDLVHPDDREGVRRAHQAVLEGEDQAAFTLRVLRKDGEYRWMETKAHPLWALGHEPTGIITSSRDVSGHVELMAQLEDREATIRSVIESFDDLVFIFDEAGRFREYHQPRGRTDLYRAPEEFVDRHHSEVLPPVISEPLGAALSAVEGGQSMVSFEYELPFPSGTRHFEARLSPLKGKEEGEVGSVAVVREITERKAEEEVRLVLARASEKAERLESLAYLAGGTAHQFNNLLTVIQGNLLLAREEALGSDAQAGISAALEAAEKAAEVTRRLHNSAGRVSGPMRSVDPRELLAAVRERFEGESAGGVRFELELPATVPTVLGDLPRLREAVRHVVDNAREAVGEGGSVRVRLGHGHFDSDSLQANRIGPPPDEGEYVVIEVEDDGPGIAPDQLPRIFEPFFTTRFIGRGLGLAEVAGTLRLHGGAVLAESRPGEGTRVTLLLPVEKE